MKTIPCLTLAILLLVAAPSVLAAPVEEPIANEQTQKPLSDNPWEVNLVLGTEFIHNADYALDYFSDGDWVNSARFGIEVETLTDLFIQPAFVYGSLESTVFDRFDSNYSFYRFELTIRKGIAVTPWFRPYASITGMLIWNETSIHDGTNTLRHEDSLDSPLLGGRGALGFELILPRSILRSTSLGKSFLRDLTFSLAFEAGYLLQQDFDMGSVSHDTTTVEDVGSLTAGTLDLGTLSMNGWFMSIDFRLHF